MQVNTNPRYAKAIEASKRVRWDIERDVIRGRVFDTGRKFLPDALSRAAELPFLSEAEARFLSQVQGRTYANMFALVERFVSAKVLQVAAQQPLADPVALEALVRLTDEELKHQALFRRLEGIAAAQMPPGYRFVPAADAVAAAVLARSTWAVLALTLNIELFSLAHYRCSIDGDATLCPLWKDVFLFHWKEESQHAVVGELEWRAEHARLSAAEREQGVDDLIALFGAVDATAQVQAAADADYVLAHLPRALDDNDQAALRHALRAAYRWQYIGSGLQEPRYVEVLKALTTTAQMQRIGAALAPILEQAQP